MDASLDEIARRAGVASGTLYRHFLTRMDLVEAVLADQISELVESGRALLTADDSFAAFSAWSRATLDHGLTYRGLSAAVMSSALDRDGALVARWHAELFEVGAALLERARRSGVVVADADATDVLKLIGAIARVAQDAPDGGAQAERLLGLVLNGLAQLTHQRATVAAASASGTVSRPSAVNSASRGRSVGAEHPPPQQRGQGADVGQVRPDVHPEQHRQHDPGRRARRPARRAAAAWRAGCSTTLASTAAIPATASSPSSDVVPGRSPASAAVSPCAPTAATTTPRRQHEHAEQRGRRPRTTPAAA